MTDKNIGKRILLAEDNELNAEIAMELLKEEGFLIDWVKDGQECFDKLEESDDGYYDLILMDIQMPILNGYDTTAKIRQMENPKKATTPIVAMTANSFDEDIEMTQKAGMNGFIAKPLDAEKMFTILKQSIVENVPRHIPAPAALLPQAFLFLPFRRLLTSKWIKHAVYFYLNICQMISQHYIHFQIMHQKEKQFKKMSHNKTNHYLILI